MADFINYLLVSKTGEQIGRMSIPGFVPKGYSGKLYLVKGEKIGSFIHRGITHQGFLVVEEITPDPEIVIGCNALPIREARELFEKEYLVAQMRHFSGNVSRAAEFIGMERSALHRKMRDLGIAEYAEMSRCKPKFKESRTAA